MSELHSGSCLCGKVQYALSGDFQSFFLCHCTRCQKDTGSAHAANLFAANSVLTWVQGEHDVKTYQHPGTLHSKSFCQHCGSALPTFIEPINAVAVPAGSLDSPVPIAPTANIFLSRRADWADNIDSLPGFDELPGK